MTTLEDIRPVTRSDARLQMLCALGGPAALVLTLGAWLVAGILPLPLGSSSTQQEVVDFYAEHQTRVLFGIVVSTLSLGAVFPLIAVLTIQMRRMEGRAPIMTVLQTITGAATGVFLIMPMLMMAVAGFRPERSPELTLTLNDLAWLLFLTPIAPFIIQNVSIAVAVLRDPNHVFPRWVGYANLWIGALFLPDVLAFFFFHGPFAWNGIFVFWLALAAYSVWLLLMPYAVIQALRRSVAAT